MSPTLSAALLALAAPPAVDRSIGKEPTYQSAAPTYCLLTFGPDAKDRVWLVRDGDALFVDRNGNGDLTDPGERVVEADRWKPGGVRRCFDVPTLTVGGRTHANLSVEMKRVSSVATSMPNWPVAQATALADPKGWAARVTVEIESAKYKGTKPDGRIDSAAGMRDLFGLLVFAGRPADAPVVRFDGSLSVSMSGLDGTPPTLRPGRDVTIGTSIGTPGVGQGTFATIETEGVVPDDARLVLDVTYPSGGPDEPVRYELPKHGYGPVRAPSGTRNGMATVVVSMVGWPDGAVAPLTARVAVTDRITAPAERMSPKLARVIPFPDRRRVVEDVRFAPDGRLFAAEYGSRAVRLFDPISGNELVGFKLPRDISQRHPNSVQATADYNRVHVRYEGPNLINQSPSRTACDGEVMVWNLTTGRPLPSIRPTVPRGIVGMAVSPDGSKMVTVEREGYYLSDSAKEPTVVRDLTAGTMKVLSDQPAGAVFSPDGGALATIQGREGSLFRLTVLDPAKFVERWGSEGGRTFSDPWPVFSPDGKLLVSATANVRDGKFAPGSNALRVFDTETGTLRAEFPEGKIDFFVSKAFSPDGRWLGAMTNKRGLTVWDVATWKPKRMITFDDVQSGRDFAFSPDGSVLAVAASKPWVEDENEPLPNPDDLPHNRVYLFDPATDAPPEVLVGPRGGTGGIAFAPDGRTLAVGGAGGVAIYDLGRR